MPSYLKIGRVKRYRLKMYLFFCSVSFLIRSKKKRKEKKIVHNVKYKDGRKKVSYKRKRRKECAWRARARARACVIIYGGGRVVVIGGAQEYVTIFVPSSSVVTSSGHGPLLSHSIRVSRFVS